MMTLSDDDDDDDDADDDDDQILNIRISIYIFSSQSFLSFHSYLLINYNTRLEEQATSL